MYEKQDFVKPFMTNYMYVVFFYNFAHFFPQKLVCT